MADPEGAVELVDQKVQNWQNRIDGAVDQALTDTSTFLDALAETLDINVPYSSWSFQPFILPQISITAVEPERPDLDSEISKALSGIDRPSRPAYLTINPAAAPNIADFTDELPRLDLPNIPDPEFPSEPGSPNIADVSIPVRPSFDLPATPSIQQITIPPAPSGQIPAFSYSMPINDLVPPVNTFNFTEQEYLSDLLDAIKLKVSSTIVNGGAGLGAEIEQAIWDRQRERDDKLIRDKMDDLVSEYSEKAYDLPTGALVGAVRKVLSDYTDSKIDAGRTMTIEQAKLALENYHIALQSGVQVETIWIAHHDNVQERSLNVQKAIVEIAVSIYSSEANNYNLKLRTVEIAREIYETEIKAQLQQLEYYRLQLESGKLTIEIQGLYVTLYRAQLEGLNALLGIYKTDMEAANLGLSAQKLKVDIFGKQIDAFSSRISAEATKYQAYKAKTEGELAKATAFEAKARGYTAYVQGQKTVSDIQIANLDVLLRGNDQKVREYEADITLYRAGYANAMERVKAAAEMFAADADIYKADLSKAEAEGRLEVEQARILQTNISADRQLLIEVARMNLNAFIQVAGLKQTTAQAGAQLGINKLSALLGSINHVVQMASTGLSTEDYSAATP